MKFYVHDAAKALAEARSVGKSAVLLRYQGGGNLILLASGQRLRATPKDRTVSGKAERHERIKARRMAKLATAQQGGAA